MRSPVAHLRGLRHPEGYHGHGVTHEFFEGWYFKFISQDLRHKWAVIPGIFRGLKSSQSDEVRDEAFVQILDGTSGKSWFHNFDVNDFWASDSSLDIRVGPNHFSPNGVHLETPQLSGDIRITTPLEPWPLTLRELGAMGWYGYVPFMECFHAVVSFGHALEGSLTAGSETQSFTGGRGYIEKDWGKAFPEGYIWLASNHIDTDPNASLIGSVAIIPWLNGAFRGFLVGLKHGGTLYRWATYNGSRELDLRVDDTHVYWSMRGKDGTLELVAERKRGGLLRAPQRESMVDRVEETLDARVSFVHKDASGRELLRGNAAATGLEIVGDIDKLIALPQRRR